jgi:hypothetical protein
MRTLRLLVVILAVHGLLVARAAAQSLRVALIVGNNAGAADEQPLRYAEADADRISRLLVGLARFPASETIVLRGRTASDVRGALAALAERLSETPGEHLFFFYYSGHADARALHLGSSQLAFAELKRDVEALRAAVRIVVVDACQSGALTRVKGGTPGASFELTRQGEPTRGLAILASASPAELAQESDELKASFFTHHFEAGLRGLADRDRDGRVTLSESFDYASNQTLRTTVATSAGPQHPSFRYDLVGQRDVVLTEPQLTSAGFGQLHFDRPGWYFVSREGGPFVTEMSSTGDERLALEAGRYEIRRRGADRLQTASAHVASGTQIAVSTLPTSEVAFGRAVRKGAGVRARAYALGVEGSARSGVASLGPAFGGGILARLDVALGSLELRANVARAESTTRIPAETWEASARLAALVTWDIGEASIAGGVEAGVSFLRQAIDREPVRWIRAPVFGPTLTFELPWAARAFVRTELGAPVYVVSLENREGGGELAALMSARGTLGAGVYF